MLGVVLILMQEQNSLERAVVSQEASTIATFLQLLLYLQFFPKHMKDFARTGNRLSNEAVSGVSCHCALFSS